MNVNPNEYAGVWARVNTRETIHRWLAWVRSNPELAKRYAEQHDDIRRALSWVEEQAAERERLQNVQNTTQDTSDSLETASRYGNTQQESEVREVVTPTITERPVDVNTVYNELSEKLIPEHRRPISLEQQPVVDSKIFKDAEYGLEDEPMLLWVQTDKIVGRPSADSFQDGWAHEYERRAGRIQEISAELSSEKPLSVERVFHINNKEQRIQLAAYDGPEGPMYDVRDGSHRVAGTMRAGIVEFPASVRRVRFEFSFVGRNEDQAFDIRKKIELGLIQGEVSEQQDEQGKKYFVYTIKNEIVPWLHTTSQKDLIKISRTYEKLYPGALEKLPIPRDILVDPVANNYYMARRWGEWEQKFANQERDEDGIVKYTP